MPKVSRRRRSVSRSRKGQGFRSVIKAFTRSRRKTSTRPQRKQQITRNRKRRFSKRRRLELSLTKLPRRVERLSSLDYIGREARRGITRSPSAPSVMNRRTQRPKTRKQIKRTLV